MSDITHGNNPQQMQELAALLKQKSEEINSMVATLSAKLDATGWVGPDSTRFRGEWAGHRAQLTNIAGVLDSVGSTVLQNKQEQESVSS